MSVRLSTRSQKKSEKSSLSGWKRSLYSVLQLKAIVQDERAQCYKEKRMCRIPLRYNSSQKVRDESQVNHNQILQFQ